MRKENLLTYRGFHFTYSHTVTKQNGLRIESGAVWFSLDLTFISGPCTDNSSDQTKADRPEAGMDGNVFKLLTLKQRIDSNYWHYKKEGR